LTEASPADHGRGIVTSMPTLDELYTILSSHGPSLTNGFTSHAPMVAETLVEHGQAEAAGRWVHAHLHEGTPRPQPIEPIDPSEPDNWQAALGASKRFSDWSALMTAELERLGWREGLDLWAGRLAPGFPAAATHGLLRTAHAARAVAAQASPARLVELADGLALWASTYQRLPGERRADATRRFDIEAALAEVPRVPVDMRRNGGAITTALKVLADLPDFAAVLGRFDAGDDPRATGHKLARAFAGMFLAQARDPLTAIVFTHAVTSTAATLWMAPLLRTPTLTELLAHAWQTGAALLAAYADAPVTGIYDTPEADDDILARAIAHGDDHVIKLSGVCIDLRAATGDPLFATLPRRARALLPPG
jgi:hypothetical protein